MITFRFSKQTEKAILSCVDKKICDTIDSTALMLCKTLHKDFDSLSAFEQRDCKYASIKAMLPDIFLKADVESTEVTPQRADNIMGRIYSRYILQKMIEKGYVKKHNGRPVISDEAGAVMLALLKADIKLSDI